MKKKLVFRKEIEVEFEEFNDTSEEEAIEVIKNCFSNFSLETLIVHSMLNDEYFEDKDGIYSLEVEAYCEVKDI